MGCRRQNPRAQEALYELLAGRMMSVSRRYSPSREEAEEVLQAAFVRVFRRLDQYRGEGSFEGWVKRIVIRTALSSWRQRQVREAGQTDSWEQIAEPVSKHPSGYEALAARDVLDLLDTLPPGYRMVINLYAIEGYSHGEIAEMLGISEGTSKSQLARGRALLEKRLSHTSTLPAARP